MIGEAVRDLLRAEHYAVDWATDGDMADAALAAQSYDLVLLDLGLPRRDGLAVLRSLRARKDRTPVLIATARDGVAQRVEGLDAGADDYVLKPYDLDELLARIRALLRRASGRAEPVYEHQGVALNPGTREASVNGRPVVPMTRAPLASARAASGMSAVTSTSWASTCSAIQSSAASGPSATTTISTGRSRGTAIRWFATTTTASPSRAATA